MTNKHICSLPSHSNPDNLKKQCFSKAADESLRLSVRSLLGSKLGVIFCHFLLHFVSYMLVTSNGMDSDCFLFFFPLWIGSLVTSHSASWGEATAQQADTRVELGFGGLFRLIKRDALLFMQARETVLGAKGGWGGWGHQQHLSSSTFTSTQGSFHRTLRSIGCLAACNGKKAAGVISEGT